MVEGLGGQILRRGQVHRKVAQVTPPGKLAPDGPVRKEVGDRSLHGQVSEYRTGGSFLGEGYADLRTFSEFKEAAAFPLNCGKELPVHVHSGRAVTIKYHRPSIKYREPARAAQDGLR